MASNFLRDFVNKISGTSYVDNTTNPSSALNKQKRSIEGADTSPSWQAKGVRQKLDKIYKNTTGKTFGAVPLPKK